LWCQEGLLAWERYKPFLIMGVGCGAGAFDAGGVRDVRGMTSLDGLASAAAARRYLAAPREASIQFLYR
jgi:hypothetical protein